MDNHLIIEFQNAFNSLNYSKIQQGMLEDMYHPEVRFIDPMHVINGLEDLKQLFSKQYKNLISIHFEYGDPMIQDDHAMLFWTMIFQHSKLKNGKEIKVDGCSLVRFRDGLVIFHRDYFDSSDLLFRNVPVIGKVLDFIAAKAS